MASLPEDSVMYNIEGESLPQKVTEEMQPPEDEYEREEWLAAQFFGSFPIEGQQKDIELEDIFSKNDVNFHFLAEGIVLNTLDLLLRKSKLTINSQQITKLINDFPLYNGNIRVTVKTATISLSRTNSIVIDQPGTRGRKPNSQSQGGKFPRPSNSILFSAVQPKTIKKKIFTFHGKAVQKIELFSRFPQIFAKYLPPPTDSTVNDGLELFQTLSRICSLVYRYAITEEQRQELATLVRNLIELTCKLRNELVGHFDEQEPDGDEVHIVLNEDVEDEIVDAFDLATQQSASQANQQSQSKWKPKAVQMLYTVTAKLHNLLHYFDLTARFGPLNWQSTLRYERRHFTTINRSFRCLAITEMYLPLFAIGSRRNAQFSTLFPATATSTFISNIAMN